MILFYIIYVYFLHKKLFGYIFIHKFRFSFKFSFKTLQKIPFFHTQVVFFFENEEDFDEKGNKYICILALEILITS